MESLLETRVEFAARMGVSTGVESYCSLAAVAEDEIDRAACVLEVCGVSRLWGECKRNAEQLRLLGERIYRLRTQTHHNYSITRHAEMDVEAALTDVCAVDLTIRAGMDALRATIEEFRERETKGTPKAARQTREAMERALEAVTRLWEIAFGLRGVISYSAQGVRLITGVEIG